MRGEFALDCGRRHGRLNDCWTFAKAEVTHGGTGACRFPGDGSSTRVFVAELPACWRLRRRLRSGPRSPPGLLRSMLFHAIKIAPGKYGLRMRQKQSEILPNVN